MVVDKKSMTEAEIRTNYITPALRIAGWDTSSQVREEYPLTAGRIIARGVYCKRQAPKRPDYVLFIRPNKPIAVIEAKDNKHIVSDGIQQAMEYAEKLDVPFVFSSNGDGFTFINRYVTDKTRQTRLSLEEFPSPETLWNMYITQNDLTEKQKLVIAQPYYVENPRKQPRYYQLQAINKTVEAIANGNKRVLLVMATGTGKTYTAFQIIWRLWKSGIKKRILFLADRTALIAQTFRNDFAPFKDSMTWVKKNNFDTAHEIYLALYQGIMSEDSSENSLFKKFSPEFFDLIVVDECHRGSAKENSQWREVLDYFHNATHIGLTATPKETDDVSTTGYFGKPIYNYTLKQGIQDGFLAPYRVIKLFFDKDIEGFVPAHGQLDDNGQEIIHKVYTTKNFDKDMVIEERTKHVARYVSDYLKTHNCRMEKTIFFCVDQEHAARMREALVNENADLCAENEHYVMRITANDEEGIKQIDNFADVSKEYPVLVTTSKLLSTGVDTQTVRNIVIDQNIGSMTEFKQIIGRGSRVREDYDKYYFTIFDFRNATNKFFDRDFDGDPEPTDPKQNPPKPKPKNRTAEPHKKYYLNGQEIVLKTGIVQYLDIKGTLVTENLVDYTRKNVKQRYATLEAFLSDWQAAEKKKMIISEMEANGIPFSELSEELDCDLDPFDLICHVVYDKPAITRIERVSNVRNSKILAQYGEKAANVLDSLLAKYADYGVIDLEDIDILKTSPISEFGTPLAIVNNIFGGIDNYRQAIKDLETALYNVA